MANVFVNADMNIFIDTTPDEAEHTWVPFGDGITSCSEELNEQGVDAFYLINKGFGSHTVTGMSPRFTITGHRALGDPAQDWIFSRKWELGCKRKTALKVELFDRCTGDMMQSYIVESCTIADLQEFSGSVEGASDISMTLYFNVAPNYLAIAPKIIVSDDRTSAVKFKIESLEGQQIFYSTDGSEPSIEYTAEVTLSTPGEITIKAVAKKEGYRDSEVIEKSVTVV